MPSGTSNLYKVHVGGLARIAVRRDEEFDTGLYDMELSVGDFFHSQGCRVAEVRLMVDAKNPPKPSISRGFAWVEFEDEASFNKALSLDGTTREEMKKRGDIPEVPLDEKCVKILISKPKLAKESPEQTALKVELAKERERLEGLQRELSFKSAKVNDLYRQVRNEKQFQLDLEKTEGLGALLQEERARQQKVLATLKELEDMEVNLNAELREERERSQGLSQICRGVVIEKSAERPELSTAMTDWGLFVEQSIDPEAVALVRSRSTRSYADGEDARRASPSPNRVAQAWAIKKSGEKDLPRQMLEGKMEMHDGCSRPSAGPQSSRWGRGAVNDDSRRTWAELGDEEEEEMQRAMRSNCQEVLVRNLPLLSAHELEAALRKQFLHFWQAYGMPDEPSIKEIKVTEREVTYRTKAAGTEASVLFSDRSEAMWFIQQADQKTSGWSSAGMSVHGQPLKIELPAGPPPVDWRHMTWRADTDVSSKVSYRTVGTRQSCSTAVRRNAALINASSGGQSSAEHRDGKGAGKQGPPHNDYQNRTVVLEGIPRSMKEYIVIEQVLSLLKRLYKQSGYNFSEATHLHKQRADQAVQVKRPSLQRKEDENGGTVFLKLLNYGDARWLVEQARGLKIDGQPIRASWARPRDSKAGGKSFGKGQRSDGKGDFKGTNGEGKGSEGATRSENWGTDFPKRTRPSVTMADFVT